MTYIYVGVGGMIGSVMRFLIASLPFSTVHSFPFATFLTNMLGSFLLGILVTNSARLKINRHHQLLLGTGAIGSFTTLSAVSAETARLISEGEQLIAFIYIFSCALGGILAAALGLKFVVKRKEETHS